MRIFVRIKKQNVEAVQLRRENIASVQQSFDCFHMLGIGLECKWNRLVKDIELNGDYKDCLFDLTLWLPVGRIQYHLGTTIMESRAPKVACFNIIFTRCVNEYHLGLANGNIFDDNLLIVECMSVFLLENSVEHGFTVIVFDGA